MKKIILVTTYNPSQHGFYTLLNEAFKKNKYYKLREIYLGEYTDIWFRPNEGCLSKRFKALNQFKGSKIKRIIKRIATLPNISTWIFRILKLIEFIPCLLYNIFIERKNLAALHRNIASAISNAEAIAVVIPAIVSYPSAALYMPRSKNIPVIGVPSYGILDLEYYCQTKQMTDIQHRGTLLRAITDILVPNWGHYVSGQRFFRTPPAVTLRLLFCGLSRKDNVSTWRRRLAGGCFFTKHQKCLAAAYGMVPEDWPILGELSSDILASTIKSKDQKWPKLTEKYMFAYDRTVMFDLNNFPRFDESYLPMLCSAAKKAQNFGWNVLFCPHPGLSNEVIVYCRTHNLAVAEERTIHVLPFADLYVSYGGSTCQWAMQLGIPGIVYDIAKQPTVPGKGFKNFKAQERELFFECLHELLSDTDKYLKLRGSAREDMTNWGTLDGKCGERIVSYIEKVIQKYYRE